MTKQKIKQEIYKQEFLDFYNEYNKTQKDEDELVFIDFRETDDKKNYVDFLDEYIKVFWTYFKTVEVDNYIWFIHTGDAEYFWKSFLDFCIEKDLKDKKALDFYRHILYINTYEDKNFSREEECFKTFKYKK